MKGREADDRRIEPKEGSYGQDEVKKQTEGKCLKKRISTEREAREQGRRARGIHPGVKADNQKE